MLAEQRIDLDTGDYLSLWPHKHGTDGFFAAVLERLPVAAKEAAVEEAQQRNKQYLLALAGGIAKRSPAKAFKSGKFVFTALNSNAI